MDVSIVMINYNTFDYTTNAIKSIVENTFDVNYEIILIDNNSPDKSGDKLKEKYQNNSKIVFIQNAENLGTSKAFNIGSKRSLGKYVLWLNTDILIKHNFVKVLFEFMENNPKCGICGGNVLDFNGKPTHSFMLELPNVKNLKMEFSIIRKIFSKFKKNNSYMQFNYSNSPMKVGYITGADMMIRKKLFSEIGYFDEDIFMYAEETEFTYRMYKNTSYSAISIPDATIYHLEGGSFKNKESVFNENRYFRYLKGMYIYFCKSYSKEDANRFLRVIKNGNLKFMIIFFLLFKFKKSYICKKRFLAIKKYLLEYKE